MLVNQTRKGIVAKGRELLIIEHNTTTFPLFFSVALTNEIITQKAPEKILRQTYISG
jgi:hypothetical protein